MKRTDIAMILLIAALSVLAAYSVGSTVLGSRVKTTSVKVKTIDPITTKVAQPSEYIFNSKAINPTVEVIIGGSSEGNK